MMIGWVVAFLLRGFDGELLKSYRSLSHIYTYIESVGNLSFKCAVTMPVEHEIAPVCALPGFHWVVTRHGPDTFFA